MGAHILRVDEETCQGTEKTTKQGTHKLEMVEGGTCQNTESNRPNEEHSLSGDDRSRVLVRDIERQRPRVHSQSGDSRGTDLSKHGKNHIEQAHLLSEDGKGGTFQNTEKPTEQGALTFWR